MLRRLDPRLLIGVALVLVSVLGVVSLITALDHRSAAYVTTVSVVPGQTIDAALLTERAVFLDGDEERYLLVGQLPTEGLVATRAIGPGELLPVAALGAVAGTSLTAVVVSPTAALSGGVQPAATVELWMTEPVNDGVLVAPPRVLVADAIVVSLTRDDGIGSFGSAPTVELLVPRARLALILQAQADGAVLSVVPTGVAWRAP